MKKKIYVILGGLLLVLVISFLYKYLNTSTVFVDLSNLPASYSSKTVLSINGEKVDPAMQVGRGKHTLKTATPCYEDVVEEFSTTIRNHKVIKPSFKEVSALEVAKTVLNVDETIFSISTAKYYGDCEWLAVFVDPVVDNTEGYAAIARYKNGEWVVLTEGTALYLGEDRPDAPEQLLIDLGGTIER